MLITIYLMIGAWIAGWYYGDDGQYSDSRLEIALASATLILLWPAIVLITILRGLWRIVVTRLQARTWIDLAFGSKWKKWDKDRVIHLFANVYDSGSWSDRIARATLRMVARRRGFLHELDSTKQTLNEDGN